MYDRRDWSLLIAKDKLDCRWLCGGSSVNRGVRAVDIKIDNIISYILLPHYILQSLNVYSHLYPYASGLLVIYCPGDESCDDAVSINIAGYSPHLTLFLTIYRYNKLGSHIKELKARLIRFKPTFQCV